MLEYTSERFEVGLSMTQEGGGTKAHEEGATEEPL